MDESAGFLRSEARSASSTETPRQSTSRPGKENIRTSKRSYLKRPLSPVSVSEAAQRASQPYTKKRRHGIRSFSSKDHDHPESQQQSYSQSKLQYSQSSASDASQLTDNAVQNHGHFTSGQDPIGDKAQIRRTSDEIDQECPSPQTLSPRSETQSILPFDEQLSVDNTAQLNTSLRESGTRQDFSLPGAVTPVRTDDDVVENFLAVERRPHSRRPRPSALDTTASQDASLPSPSLSPVTAALNLRNRGGYFEEAPHDISYATSSLDDAGNESQSKRVITSTFGSPAASEKRSVQLPALQTPRWGEVEKTEGPLPNVSMMSIPRMVDTFEAMPTEMQKYVMYQLLRRCPKPSLQFVADVVNPALKCDFLSLLPPELALNIISYLDVKSLCRAAQVSKRWREMTDGDEEAWKHRFDADGHTFPDGELRKAIQQGWGYQFASRPDDWEQDLSISGNVPSDTERSVSSSHALRSSITPSEAAGCEYHVFQGKRSKRKVGAKTKGKSRRQQKRNDPQSVIHGLDVEMWKDRTLALEGPYAAASAAAKAVPYARVGLSSLKNLHLFKSIYQRHHIIRKSWMHDKTKPRHIAFKAHQRHVVTCLQFDTDKILTGSDDTNINVYDTQTGALRARLEGHEGGVWALQYEGNVLVSGSTDRSVRVWDIEKGICTQVFQGHTSTVRCLQILMPTEIDKTSDGRPVMMPKQPLIITGSRDSNLRVWRLPKPDDREYFQAGPPPDDTDCPYFVRVLNGHHHSVRAIAAHADTLVSGSYDCTVRVWKISTGETLHRLAGHSQKVYSVVLDHKRHRCISGSMDNMVKVWSLDTGSVLYNLEGHSSLVGLLDLKEDRLVSAAADSTLRIWDPETGQCKSTLKAHTGAITCFQHDGQKVISGSDRTLKMWNVTNGRFVKDLLTDLSGVWQVNFNERRCVAAVQRNGMTYIEVCL